MYVWVMLLCNGLFTYVMSFYKISKIHCILFILIGRKFATQVPISEDRDFLWTLTHFITSKLFYKSNIKQLLVSIYCDINTLEVVEHLRSQRNTWLMHCVPLKLLLCSTTPVMFISHSYRHILQFYIPYFSQVCTRLYISKLMCENLLG
jgi:hypothetical protein